ncbi:MAG TPA: serine/threonine-protein kinase, partial [Polyangiaceae bacterium]|nr:serine/threonine-protein kinase [Polyangiaceae bacterium]
DGVDAYRLMRRAQNENHPIPPSVAMFMAHEVCSALACVHTAVDDTGHPLAVVHRDVTPSNIYLSWDGAVKLGDFGIARLLSPESSSANTHPLKGKYAYLSPEQVAGEDFDHRADLFSLAVVLSELLINQPLFPGSGQLAVLLAIRDGRIDALYDHADRLPAGLMSVLERGLARAPSDRFRTAEQFRSALEPFILHDMDGCRQALGQAVKWARNTASSWKACVDPNAQRIPHRFEELAAMVRTRQGETWGPSSLAKLIEWTTTGRLEAHDEVDLHGEGFEQVAAIPELARHIPPSTTTTTQLHDPGAPDYRGDLPQTSMLSVLVDMLAHRETGVLFAERTQPSGLFTRKEIYLAQAKVIHVASTDKKELFGEYLVRRGLIQREELDLALAVLPRYDGRLGDTLIALNLVDAVQIFRAIRDQGRDRITEIFTWTSGAITFYRGVAPSRVEFPLDLELAPLMLAGLCLSQPEETWLEQHQHQMDDLLVGVAEIPETMRLAAWPPEVLKVVGAAGDGRSQGDIIGSLIAARLINVPSALRAIEVACAAGLLKRISARSN